MSELEQQFPGLPLASSSAIKSESRGGEAYQLEETVSKKMNFKESTHFDFSILPWLFVLILGGISMFMLHKKRYFRNYGLGSKKLELEVALTKTVSNKTQVHLVIVKGKEFLLVESAKNVQCVSLDSLQGTNETSELLMNDKDD